MDAITLIQPQSIGDVLQAFKEYPEMGHILAGGTDLLPDLRKKKKEAPILIDIHHIPELQQINITGNFLEIGAAVTFAQIEEHPFVLEQIPMLTEAARSVGALPLQNSATWVGNLVQAMPAADGAIAALALEAELYIVSLQGSTWQKVETLFRAAGVSIIDPSQQLITKVRVPIPVVRWGTGWQRLGRRNALTLPILNCAVKLELERGTISKARIALGPVAPTPMRALQAENHLVGKQLDEKILQEAALLAQAESHPRSNVLRASAEYRKTVVPVLVKRALKTAWERAQ